MKLTKAQTAMLQIAADLGGTIHVFIDQWSIATALEAAGYMTGNGRHFDRKSTITDAGRRALAGRRNDEPHRSA